MIRLSPCNDCGKSSNLSCGLLWTMALALNSSKGGILQTMGTHFMECWLDIKSLSETVKSKLMYYELCIQRVILFLHDDAKLTCIFIILCLSFNKEQVKQLETPSPPLTLSLSLSPINHHLPLQSWMVLRRRVDGMYRRLFPDRFSLVSSLSWPKCAGKSVILLKIKTIILYNKSTCKLTCKLLFKNIYML